jgi:virulence factor Mce-like protein
MEMKRTAVLLVISTVALTGCRLGAAVTAPTYKAEFSRAVQVFPAVKVRVLGVDVGQVISIRNGARGVDVTFRITRPDIRLPADVNAAVVPMSLLGERYIQLFPAYDGGPTLKPGSTIPLSRTAVPAEPDELLRSLQDYLGAIDPKTVTSFVENAAQILQGNGQQLNQLIRNAAAVIGTLSGKRDDLAGLIVELNKLTVALSTRQQAIARLIQNYGAVTGTLDANRAALEGTITGLNQAAVQLASLLIDHRTALHADIKSLTRTTRTLSRNAETLAETGKWATSLFLAASRAVDYQKDWLRLGNQGQELGALILMRLDERLIDLCQQAGLPICATAEYWAKEVPQLFCFVGVCLTSKNNAATPAAALLQAFQGIPQLNEALSGQAFKKGTSVETLIDSLLQQTIGSPWRYAGALFQ